MKTIKIVIYTCLLVIPFIPVFVTNIFFNRIEKECIEQQVQSGSDIEFAKYICED